MTTDRMPAHLKASIFSFAIFGFVVLATVLGTQTSSFRPQCQSMFSWVRDPDDCSHFWRCVWGIPYEMPRCPEGQVLNSAHHVCALKGSPYDNCDSWETFTSGTGLTPPTQTTKDLQLQRAGQPVTDARRPSPATPATPTLGSLTPLWVYTACGTNTSALLPHPVQCQLYYNCSHTAGAPLEASCAYDKLFDIRKMMCDDFWTVDCGVRTRPPSPTPAPPTTLLHDVCSTNSTALLPHAHDCRLYYDCSRHAGVGPGTPGGYLGECPYPKLFDTSTMQCEEESGVDCGARQKPLSMCDYIQPGCLHENCVHKEDGAHAVSYDFWSPSYVVCWRGLTLNYTQCPLDVVLEAPQVFSPEDRKCLSIYYVSPGHGGLRPNCTTRLDGSYPEEHGRPDLYYACRNQQVIGMARCSEGRIFDAKFSFCRLPYL